MLYKLYSAVKRCPPCRALIAALDKEFPEWQNYIEYLDADTLNYEQAREAMRIRLSRLPSLANSEGLIPLEKGPIAQVKQIKELCLTKE